MIWTLHSYDEIAPVILSPAENEEISIKEVADAIVKAVGFEGEYKVSEESGVASKEGWSLWKMCYGR